MKGFDPATSFGFQTSLDYDAVSVRGDEDDTVRFLAGLAGGGAALELSVGTDGVAFSPIRLRLAYPPEFDLMARVAGLRLRVRWGGWNGEAFTATSRRHVSVYEQAELAQR